LDDCLVFIDEITNAGKAKPLPSENPGKGPYGM
jgi:hypothetical protein